MKLKNKRTGEIGWLYCDHISIPKKMTVFAEDKDLSANHWDYNSLAELNAEWEDYEEPKEYWHIAELCGGLQKKQDTDNGEDRFNKQIGNYFETEEEAEKAVEKLKAWKRLEKCNFRFEGYDDKDRGTCGDIIIFAHVYTNGNLIDEAQPSMLNDLDLLFGGEE